MLLVLKLSGGGWVSRNAVHSFDFTTICSEKALHTAWKKFSTGKKSRRDVAEFQKYLAVNIKQRQIHKATVRDRLVHQAAVSAIESLFEKQFIYDSYSCRVGKGTHVGVERLGLFLRQASRNNTKKVYALKCDVRQFFASIDHEILMMQIETKIDDEQTLELLRTIILSHKSEYSKGIPLGNVTSQLFANIYLHELDWFMKQTLGVKQYLRYCDDFIVVSTDKYYLQSLIEPIKQFLAADLKLELHPNKVSIRSWDQGIDFLRYVSRPHATLIRTKTKRRMLARVNEKNKSSYLGVCSHANAYNLSRVVELIAWGSNPTV